MLDRVERRPWRLLGDVLDFQVVDRVRPDPHSVRNGPANPTCGPRPGTWKTPLDFVRSRHGQQIHSRRLAGRVRGRPRPGSLYRDGCGRAPQVPHVPRLPILPSPCRPSSSWPRSCTRVPSSAPDSRPFTSDLRLLCDGQISYSVVGHHPAGLPGVTVAAVALAGRVCWSTWAGWGPRLGLRGSSSTWEGLSRTPCRPPWPWPGRRCRAGHDR